MAPICRASLIALPGAMTGLIIAGVSPELAIRYQIIVVYLGLGAAAMAAVTVVTLGQRLLFDDAQRLRPLEDLTAHPQPPPPGATIGVSRACRRHLARMPTCSRARRTAVRLRLVELVRT